MMVRRLHTVHEFLAVLAEPTPERHGLRGWLTAPQGRLPSRRTWERRLEAIPATLPAQIGCVGRHLIALRQPWADCARAAAIDSPGGRLAQARPGGWRRPASLDGYRSPLDQIGLARLGVWLDTAPGLHGGARLDAPRGSTHPRQGC